MAPVCGLAGMGRCRGVLKDRRGLAALVGSGTMLSYWYQGWARRKVESQR